MLAIIVPQATNPSICLDFASLSYAPSSSAGRGALVTSFCLFQFMALYSTIQFANALLIVFASSFLR